MASEDPRALLRAARKERRVAHPHASYTSTGNLLCNLCEVPIKSEAAWGAHLHSTGHTLRLVREQDAAVARKTEVSNGKKRKAGSPEDGEDENEEDRKRVKGSGGEDVASRQRVNQPEREAEPAPAAPAPEPPTENTAAELDALEADLAALERENKTNAAGASATISAPSQTAEELAAQAREELSAQRGRRDAELEEAKEDAARALEEEFAEMQTLEERVRKLREKRELLRTGTMEQAAEGATPEVDGGGPQKIAGASEDAEKPKDEVDESDDEDEDDEDFDDWSFGAR